MSEEPTPDFLDRILVVVISGAFFLAIAWVGIKFSPFAPARYEAEPSTASGAPGLPGDIAPGSGVRLRDSLILEALAEQARPAKTTIELDTQMLMGRTYEATLIVERGDGTATARIMDTTDQPWARDVPVSISREAAAHASSTKFEIVRTSPEWLTFSEGAPGVWSWNITPKTGGPGKITFTMYHKVLVDSREHDLLVERYPQDVTVNVGFWYSVGSSWRSFMSWFGEPLGIVSSAVGLITSWFAFRAWRRRKAAPGQAEDRTDNADAGASPTSVTPADQPDTRPRKNAKKRGIALAADGGVEAEAPNEADSPSSRD